MKAIAKKVFSDTWWNDFLLTSKKMTIPAVFKNCLTSEETFLMRQCILDILRELAELRTTQYGYRVFSEKGVVYGRSEMDFIYDSPPIADETLEQWWYRLFDDKKIGMIINDGERFSLKLSKMIADKIAPLLEKTGVPTEGIIFTLFIGNYESTPLGIHLDRPGKNVIHFHLGPGEKTIYTWDTDEYKKIAGKESQNNFDLDAYLPMATKNDFNEGDLFCMPEDTFHIGMQDGLSIGIGCWCYNRSKHDFAERLLKLLKTEYLKNNRDFTDRKPEYNLKPDFNSLDDSSFLDSTGTLDLFGFPKGFEQLTFREVLKEVYTDFRYSLHSNAAYRASPFPKKEELTFKMEDTVQLAKPYIIKYKLSHNKEKIHLFVRGVKFEFNNFDCIKQFIDKINEGEPVQVKKLLSILNEDWDEGVGFHLLNLLNNHHGILVN